MKQLGHFRSIIQKFCAYEHIYTFNLSNIKKNHPDNGNKKYMEEWRLIHNEVVGIKLFSIYSILLFQAAQGAEICWFINLFLNSQDEAQRFFKFSLNWGLAMFLRCSYSFPKSELWRSQVKMGSPIWLKQLCWVIDPNWQKVNFHNYSTNHPQEKINTTLCVQFTDVFLFKWENIKTSWHLC